MKMEIELGIVFRQSNKSTKNLYGEQTTGLTGGTDFSFLVIITFSTHKQPVFSSKIITAIQGYYSEYISLYAEGDIPSCFLKLVLK